MSSVWRRPPQSLLTGYLWSQGMRKGWGWESIGSERRKVPQPGDPSKGLHMQTPRLGRWMSHEHGRPRGPESLMPILPENSELWLFTTSGVGRAAAPMSLSIKALQ